MWQNENMIGRQPWIQTKKINCVSDFDGLIENILFPLGKIGNIIFGNPLNERI